MSTSLQVNQQLELQAWKTPTQIKMRVQAIQQLMSEVLKPGTKDNEFSGDYGIIPGTGKKPSLWKSGSEQILAMFEIAVEPVVEDLSTDDCYRYRVTTRLTHSPSGQFLGAGVGEASSDETKYKWRRTYSQKEFESTPLDRRRIKFSQFKDASGWTDKEEMQIRTEPADVANTILKMAKKRSQIDATLTVTGASSMFDQDLEDMTEEQKQQMQERDGKKKGKEKPVGQVKCAQCNAIGGHLPHCPTKKQPANAPAAEQASPKEDHVMCGDCGTVDGHTAECKYAKTDVKEDPPEWQEVAVVINSVEPKETRPDKAGKTKPYQILMVTDADKFEWKMYVWHQSLHQYLKPKQMMVCKYSERKDKDQTFCSLERVLELAGVTFQDNKPVAA